MLKGRDEPSLEIMTNGNVSCPFNFTRDQFTSDAFRVNLLSSETCYIKQAISYFVFM